LMACHLHMLFESNGNLAWFDAPPPAGVAGSVYSGTPQPHFLARS